MEFYFSFNQKTELIIVDEQRFTNDIGALLQCVIDTDWTALQKQINLWITNEIPSVCWSKHVDQMLEDSKCHPVFRKYLFLASENGTLAEEIQKLTETKEILRAILETLVDEDKNEYAMRLYELFHEYIQQGADSIFADQNELAQLPVKENPGIEIKKMKGFRTVYTTDELTTILYRELSFICSNHFIIRKCINCRNFFWTRSTTKVYCSRQVPMRKATCSQYGPRRKQLLEKRPAYQLYWNQRTRVFTYALRTENSSAFRKWVKATAPYKELSVRGDITLEEMAEVLGAIEMQLFPSLISSSKETVG